jgi:two-component system CitB family sensor kinase
VRGASGHASGQGGGASRFCALEPFRTLSAFCAFCSRASGAPVTLTLVTDDSSPRGPRARPPRRRRRFATEVLLLQLAVVTAIVLLTTAVFVGVAVQRLAHEAESTALAVAQSVAADGDVRSEVAALSVDGTALDEEALAAGPLQLTASSVQQRTGALFVVVTDDRGVRLAHPEPERIGERVSTSPDAALRGEETVSWERGTLGDSARAKVPVFAPEAAAGERPVVVGEVSVGFAPARVYDTVARDALPVVGVAALALLLGVVASVLIRRRLDRLTLGLQPDDLATLVQNQQAVLGGVGEGVLAVDRDGRVSVCNEQAAQLLSLDGPGDAVVGRALAELDLPGELADLLDPARASSGSSATHASGTTLVVGRHVLIVDVRPVAREGVDLGRVAVLRDRTAVEALTRRLDAVGAMTTALRAQRHEFANRLHAVAGLLAIGRVEQAQGYLADVLEHGPLRYPVKHADRLAEPYLQAFVGAKGVEAAERGVLLQLGPETLVSGSVVEPGDVTTVLGNLVDNAVRAAVAGGTTPAWVEVELLDDGADLHLSVMDSGDGVARPERLFERRRDVPGRGPGPERDALDETGGGAGHDPVHGLGFGLPLSRDTARRRGGDVWLGSPGGGGHGAVFCARLVGAVQPAADPSDHPHPARSAP